MINALCGLKSKSCTMGFSRIFFFGIFFFNFFIIFSHEKMKHVDQRVVRIEGFPPVCRSCIKYVLLSAPIRSSEEARKEETSRHFNLKQAHGLFHTYPHQGHDLHVKRELEALKLGS